MSDADAAELDTLRLHLLECAEEYLKADLPSQRRAVQNSLIAVAKHLEKCGFPAVTLLPVVRPALALFERDEHNAIDQMFAERARSGRPSTTNDEHLRTAILAALANAWLRIHHGDGRPQRTKLEEAARNMRGPWFEGVTAAALKTSREIVAREARDHEVVEYFERFSRLIDRISQTIGLSRSFSFMVRHVNEHPIGRAMGILKTTPVSTLEQE